MSTHIPNSFQTPNLFIDRAMEHLTDSEFRVLMFATRHIYGWQDRVEKNLAYISLKMFEDGYTTKDGQQYYGCGLSRGAIIKAVQSLVDYGLLARDGKPTEKGQAYKIGEVIDWNRLEQRTAKRRDDYQKKTVKATETRQGVTSDVPVTSHDTTQVTSDVTMRGNVARTESNTSSNTSSNPAGAAQVSHSDNDATATYIKAWLEGQSTQPAINQYGNKTNRNIAKQLANAGIPKEKVTAFTKHLAAQPYWKGKLVPITTVGNDIAAWLSSAAAPAPINPAHVKIEPIADHDAPDRELIETTIADLAKRFSVKDEVQRVPTNIEAA